MEKINKNTIYNADCLEIMPQIEDKSVDMILCDLPYGVLNKSNPKAKWDSVIPFDALWKQYRRIIKPNGAIVLFGSGMFTAKCMVYASDIWRYNWIWEKTNCTGFLNVNRMPLRKHEDIMVFYKCKPTYNPQIESCTSHISGGCGNAVHKGVNNHYLNNIKYLKPKVVNTKFPTDIIKFRRDSEKYHPTQKPIALCEYLIKTYSNEGDLVLDNCCGSGTTCLAAKNTGRQFIGIEKDPEYYNIARERCSL